MSYSIFSGPVSFIYIKNNNDNNNKNNNNNNNNNNNKKRMQRLQRISTERVHD